MSAKRKNLNVLEKLRLIKESKAKSKRNLVSQCEETEISANEDVNELTWQWFGTGRSKNMIVSGPIIQAKALELASQQNLPDVKASNGWLERFRNRYNIMFKILSGESAGVNPDGCILERTARKPD